MSKRTTIVKEKEKNTTFKEYCCNLSNKSYKCWWCTLNIEHKLIGCPIYVHHNKKETEYVTEGLFCSFECVKAYILSKKDDALYKNSLVFLSHMVNDARDIMEPIIINPSPPKEFLIEYGGYMTHEQYKNQIGKVVIKKICNTTDSKIIFQETKLNVI